MRAQNSSILCLTSLGQTGLLAAAAQALITQHPAHGPLPTPTQDHSVWPFAHGPGPGSRDEASEPRSPSLGPWSHKHPTPVGPQPWGWGVPRCERGTPTRFCSRISRCALGGGLQLLHVHTLGAALGLLSASRRSTLLATMATGCTSRHLGRDLELHSGGGQGPACPTPAGPGCLLHGQGSQEV